MTEFYDPWEHFYDHDRTDDPRQLVPTEYRLREISEAMGDVHGLKGTAALEWTDTWLAERLLRLRPALSLLTAYVVRALDEEGVGVLADSIREGYDDAVLSHCLAKLPSEELQVAEPARSIPAFVRGADGALCWHASCVERFGGPESPRFAHVLGRCLANRDWQDLNGKLQIDEATGAIEPGPALLSELRKQLAGSKTPRWTAQDAPFAAKEWLRELIEARMEAACVSV
jgi:hypothetical protein